MRDDHHTQVIGVSYTSDTVVHVTFRIRPSSRPVEKYPPIWSAVPVRWVTALMAPNGHSAPGAVVVLDEATLVSVTPTGPRSLPACCASPWARYPALIL